MNFSPECKILCVELVKIRQRVALEEQRGGKRGQEEWPAPLYRASWSNDSQSFRLEADIEGCDKVFVEAKHLRISLEVEFSYGLYCTTMHRAFHYNLQSYRCLNPSSAEPGYVLPLQTV